MIEQTPQETLEIKMIKQMETFSFNPPINLSEGRKCVICVTSFEATNSVSNTTDETNSLSITTPGHWNSKSAEKTIDELNKILQLRSQNNIELHVEEVRERGNKLKTGDNEYKLSDFVAFKKEILEDLKSAKYHDLEDLVYRMGLSYDEIVDAWDIKYFPSEKTCITIPNGISEEAEINKLLQYLSPNTVKVSITIDDIRLRSNSNINQSLIFTKKSFFYTVLGFTQSPSGPLNDIEGFIQLIPGSNESYKAINITGVHEVHLKCDCINGSIVNGIQ